MDTTKNWLVVVGGVGLKVAYLNVPEAEAIRRYFAANPDAQSAPVQVIDFFDSFYVYDAWEPDGSGAMHYVAARP